jgi:hypothetical protein
MTKDIILFALSLLFTILLTVIGAEMTISPPTTKDRKWLYRGLFVFCGVLVLVTSVWGFVRSSVAQNKSSLEIEGQGQQLNDIKATVNRVADSSNCPEIRQLAATVDKIAQQPVKTLSVPPVSPTIAVSDEPKLSDFSNAQLAALAESVYNAMPFLQSTFDREDDTLNGSLSGAPERQELVSAQKQKLRDALAARCQQLSTEANDLEFVIIQRLGSGQVSRKLGCSPTDSSVLGGLASKLPPETPWWH